MNKYKQRDKQAYNTAAKTMASPENLLSQKCSFIAKYGFALFVTIFALLKQVLVSNLPIYAIAYATVDDKLMVNMASSLLNGHWLGSYSSNTLVKGMAFPLFLAISNFFGISYIMAATLLYSLSCIIFVYAIKGVFHRIYYKYFLYMVLLFNPVSMAQLTLQRVYRNGITLSQVLIIFGCFFAIFLRRGLPSKKLIPWALGAGLGLASLWNTREDSFWILPFVLVITIIIIVSNFHLYHSFHDKICKEKIAIAISPIIMLLCSIGIISCINYEYYGIFTTNELNNSNFTSAMKSIYAVMPDKTIQYVSVPREKVNQLYKVSPTMAKLKPYLEDSMNTFTKWDRHPNDAEVEDGWFFWSLREAVANAGYYSNAQRANEIYAKIHLEIEEALNSGKLKRQPTMPSALMSPWRKGYGEQFSIAVKTILPFVANYNSVGASTEVSASDGANGIRLFEAVTGNHAIYQDESYFNFSGWYVIHNNNLKVHAEIIDSTGAWVEDVPFSSSDDIYQFFLKKKQTYKNAKSSRFSVKINNKEKSEIWYLSIVDSDRGKEIEKIPLDGSVRSGSGQQSDFYFDNISVNTEKDFVKDFAQNSVKYINFISKIYQKIGMLLAVFGCVCYAFITILLFDKTARKNQNISIVSLWVILTGLLGSFIVLVFGVAYNEIASCPSINYMYLSGTYPIMISFCSIGICGVIEIIVNKWKNNIQHI